MRSLFVMFTRPKGLVELVNWDIKSIKKENAKKSLSPQIAWPFPVVIKMSVMFVETIITKIPLESANCHLSIFLKIAKIWKFKFWAISKCQFVTNVLLMLFQYNTKNDFYA